MTGKELFNEYQRLIDNMNSHLDSMTVKSSDVIISEQIHLTNNLILTLSKYLVEVNDSAEKSI